MRVVSRSGAEASIVMLTRQDEVDSLTPRKGVRSTKQMKGGETPVKAIQSEVFGQPVLYLISSLIYGKY